MANGDLGWLPLVYLAPAMPRVLKNAQQRLELALDYIDAAGDEGAYRDVTGRIREGKTAILQELLAFASFADAFGPPHLQWCTGSSRPHPEFRVKVNLAAAFAVECFTCFSPQRDSSARVRMLRGEGEPFHLVEDGSKNIDRIVSKIARKLHRGQAGKSPVVLIANVEDPFVRVNSREVLNRCHHLVTREGGADGPRVLGIALFHDFTYLGGFLGRQLCNQLELTIGNRLAAIETATRLAGLRFHKDAKPCVFV